MDPFTILLTTVLLAGAAAVTVMWRKILHWAEMQLFPWLAANMPELEPVARQAFTVLDRAVVTLRQATREAWRELRRSLLKQVADFVRQVDGGWLLQITSWIASSADTVRPQVTKVVTQQQVSYDELPADVRREYLRNNRISHSLNVTELRDTELETVDA
jgi:hypothetical protein